MRLVEVQPFPDIYDYEEDGAPWACPGLVPAGQIALLSGAPRSGKSTLIYSILSEMADTQIIFGIPAGQEMRPVSLWSEDTKKTLRDAWLKVHMPRENTAIHSVVHMNTRDESLLRWEAFLEYQLREWSENGPPSALIIDTLSLMYSPGEDSNDMSMAAGKVATLRSFANHFPDLGILLSHWERKSGGTALGSTAIVGKTDAHMTLTRDKNKGTATLKDDSKYSPFPPVWQERVELTLSFDLATGRFSMEDSVAPCAGLKDDIAAVLKDGAMTVAQIVERLNELRKKDHPVAGVRAAMNRGNNFFVPVEPGVGNKPGTWGLKA